MTPAQWHADFAARLMHNEGFRTRMYRDTMGIPTIGCGFNLQRPDAAAALHTIGVTDVAGIMAGTVALTVAQVGALLDYSDAPIIPQARAQLSPGHYDGMSDARRAAFADLDFNLGEAGLNQFVGFRGLMDQACHYAALGDKDRTHNYFIAAGRDLAGTAYASQVGARARRNVEMIITSCYVAIDAFE